MRNIFSHYRSIFIVALTFVFILLLASLTYKFKIWDAVTALSSLVALMGIIYIAYQFALQKKEYSLNQLNFMMGLSSEFQENLTKSEDARVLLSEAGRTLVSENSTGSPDDDEFLRITAALELYFQAASFKYRIAQLVKEGIIEIKLLKILYERELTEDIFHCFPELVRWSDDSHDLAANYDAKSLSIVLVGVEQLLRQMYQSKEDQNDFDNAINLETLIKCRKSMNVKVAEYEKARNRANKKHSAD